MTRKLIKRWMPDVQRIRQHKHLRFLGALLHDPNLWHLNRRSAAGACGVGLFWAFMPIPLQTIPAAITAVILRVNLPISVALVWITNPLTMAPVFYFTYKLGNWILGRTPQPVHFQLSVDWFKTSLGAIWQPFLLGSVTLSIVAGVLGYFATRGAWSWHVRREYRRRRQRRLRR